MIVDLPTSVKCNSPILILTTNLTPGGQDWN